MAIRPLAQTLPPWAVRCQIRILRRELQRLNTCSRCSSAHGAHLREHAQQGCELLLHVACLCARFPGWFLPLSLSRVLLRSKPSQSHPRRTPCNSRCCGTWRWRIRGYQTRLCEMIDIFHDIANLATAINVFKFIFTVSYPLPSAPLRFLCRRSACPASAPSAPCACRCTATLVTWPQPRTRASRLQLRVPM